MLRVVNRCEVLQVETKHFDERIFCPTSYSELFIPFDERDNLFTHYLLTFYEPYFFMFVTKVQNKKLYTRE